MAEALDGIGTVDGRGFIVILGDALHGREVDHHGIPDHPPAREDQDARQGGVGLHQPVGTLDTEEGEHVVEYAVIAVENPDKDHGAGGYRNVPGHKHNGPHGGKGPGHAVKQQGQEQPAHQGDEQLPESVANRNQQGLTEPGPTCFEKEPFIVLQPDELLGVWNQHSHVGEADAHKVYHWVIDEQEKEDQGWLNAQEILHPFPGLDAEHNCINQKRDAQNNEQDGVIHNPAEQPQGYCAPPFAEQVHCSGNGLFK